MHSQTWQITLNSWCLFYVIQNMRTCFRFVCISIHRYFFKRFTSFFLLFFFTKVKSRIVVIAALDISCLLIPCEYTHGVNRYPNKTYNFSQLVNSTDTLSLLTEILSVKPAVYIYKKINKMLGLLNTFWNTRFFCQYHKY